MTFAVPPLALYVHLPWCVRKCPYCDFNSHAIDGDIPQARYLDALIADLDAELPLLQGRLLRSVFIGGGTPSLFSPCSIHRLLRALRERLTFDSDIEVTLEANPGTVDAERFKGFVDAGVNRLSIGVQSFCTQSLRRIGRVHDGDDALRAVRSALTSGARQVNIDLMFALPGQSTKMALCDVQTACDSGVDHVSFYQLTLEPNTAFHRTPPPLPSHDEAFEIHSAGMERLRGYGFARYEVSAFARSGAHCRHNLNYWQFGDYVGLGAGAHGKLSDASQARIVRRIKQRSPARYMQGAGTEAVVFSQREVSDEERLFEFMLNALRLECGFCWDLFEQRTGLTRGVALPGVTEACVDGLLEVSGDGVRTTLRGARFLDEVLTRFLPQQV